MPDFHLFPFPFWLVVVALVYFAIRTWQLPESSLRLPMLVVLMTVAAWYVGDVLYNDYNGYLMEIDKTSLSNAWWDVLGFICAFGFLAPAVHRFFNKKYLGRKSTLLALVFHGGLKSDKFQDQIDLICRFMFAVWIGLMIVALFRTDFDFAGLFMPYLGEKADPWARARLGSGLDALWAAIGYFQIALTATFGLILALSYRTVTFAIALLVTFLIFPTYIFDRTRNTMLAIFLPGFLAWVFLRIRSGVVVKVFILVLGFLAVDSWLKFVIENRDQSTIAAAFHQTDHLKSDSPDAVRHLGLNMFEELGFINAFIADGSYRTDWGENYFSELVNPIPRSLWPGKPFIGIDYAVARGQGTGNNAVDATGVAATISTGMVGQGVVNFGRILGPLVAAILMSCWTAILARQDILGTEPGRLFLYAIGLILTFNMGRDITLLVTYPFAFGYLLLIAIQSWSTPGTSRNSKTAKAGLAAVKPSHYRIGRYVRK